MMQKDQKTSIIEANRTHATDTGSPEVQSLTHAPSRTYANGTNQPAGTEVP